MTVRHLRPVGGDGTVTPSSANPTADTIAWGHVLDGIETAMMVPGVSPRATLYLRRMQESAHRLVHTRRGRTDDR